MDEYDQMASKTVLDLLSTSFNIFVDVGRAEKDGTSIYDIERMGKRASSYYYAAEEIVSAHASLHDWFYDLDIGIQLRRSIKKMNI